jgi:hypothetical protein
MKENTIRGGQDDELEGDKTIPRKRADESNNFTENNSLQLGWLYSTGPG